MFNFNLSVKIYRSIVIIYTIAYYEKDTVNDMGGQSLSGVLPDCMFAETIYKDAATNGS